jgi:hypothetical protein
MDLEAIVKIDISTSAGRAIVRDLEKHTKAVTITYPAPAWLADVETYPLNEVFDECCSILSDYYGCNIKKL